MTRNSVELLLELEIIGTEMIPMANGSQYVYNQHTVLKIDTRNVVLNTIFWSLLEKNQN